MDPTTGHIRHAPEWVDYRCDGDFMGDRFVYASVKLLAPTRILRDKGSARSEFASSGLGGRLVLPEGNTGTRSPGGQDRARPRSPSTDNPEIVTVCLS